MIEESRWWSWRRQRLDRTARGTEDALRSVIAITGAHPSAPLALLARVPRMLQGMYDGATRAKVAVRLPAMRKAVWLMATETAHIPFHACRGTGVVERNLLRRVGVGPDRWNELREKVLALCVTPMSARDIKEASGEDAEQIQAVLNVLTATAEVVRHRAPALTSNAFSFVSTEAWLGRPLPAMPAEDALTFLAGDYLQAYGPITADDFAWWSGLPQQRCEEALSAHDPVRLDGGLLLWPAHERAFTQFRPLANRVNLLPSWDPYPMGYADRSRLGETAALEEVYDKTGASLPIVLVEGRVGGRWDFNLTRTNALTVTVTLFESPGGRLWEAIEAEAGAIGTLFQARDVKVLRAEPVRLRRRTTSGSTVAAEPASSERERRAPRTPAARANARRTPAGKRATAKRPGATRTAAKRSPPRRRTAAKRTAPKRAAARKRVATKRAPAKRVTARRAPAERTRAKKRPATKRAATKRTATGRVTAKRVTAKRAAAKRAGAKRAAAKRAGAKRAPGSRARRPRSGR